MRVTRPVRASKNQIPPRTRGQKNRRHQVGRLSLILHPPPVDPLDQWLRLAHGAISPNTERALRADLGIYRSWCEHRRLIPWPVNATPLAWFIDSMASQRAPATVRRYVASIAALCRADGRKNPLDSVMVTTALQRMHRQKGRRQAQAHGLTWALREQLLVASGDRLIDARNRALLAVAYDALLRRSELVSLQVLDLMMENDKISVKPEKTTPPPNRRGASHKCSYRARQMKKNAPFLADYGLFCYPPHTTNRAYC